MIKYALGFFIPQFTNWPGLQLRTRYWSVKWNTKRFNIFDYFCNDFIVDLFTENKKIVIIIVFSFK